MQSLASASPCSNLVHGLPKLVFLHLLSCIKIFHLRRIAWLSCKLTHDFVILKIGCLSGRSARTCTTCGKRAWIGFFGYSARQSHLMSGTSFPSSLTDHCIISADTSTLAKILSTRYKLWDIRASYSSVYAQEHGRVFSRCMWSLAV